MNNCRFARICKFFVHEGEQIKLTPIGEIPASKKRTYKKRKLSKAGRKITGLTASKADIKHVRDLLKKERQRGRLSEEQVAALDSIGKTSYENLSEVQKEQLLDIYNGPRRLVVFKNGRKK